MNHKEENEQQALFDWIRRQHYNGRRLSDVCWATPNGGRRNKKEAVRLKRQGVKAGVYDVTVAVASGGYHGMFIEMKVDDNTLSSEQVEFKNTMEREGYFCVTCYGVEDAVDEIFFYLGGGVELPPVRIAEIDGRFKYKAVCRRMQKLFKTKRGALGWLRRRGFDEFGQRL